MLIHVLSCSRFYDQDGLWVNMENGRNTMILTRHYAGTSDVLCSRKNGPASGGGEKFFPTLFDSISEVPEPGMEMQK